ADGDTLTVTQVNGQALTPQPITLPSGATLTVQAGGGYTYDPRTSAGFQALLPGQTATDTFTYTVSDGHGGTATATVTVTVTGANDLPTLDPLAAVVIDEDAGVQTVSLAGITAGGETQTLTVTATSSNPGLIPNPAITYTS